MFGKVSRESLGCDKDFRRDFLPEDLKAVCLKPDRPARDRVIRHPVTTTHIVRRPRCRDAQRTGDERDVKDLASHVLRLSQPREPGTPALREEACREFSRSDETIPIAARSDTRALFFKVGS